MTRFASKRLVLLGAAVAGLAFALAVRALTGDSSPVPEFGAAVVPQNSTATADGVELTLLRATFSGTETTIDLRVAVDGAPVKPSEITFPPASMDASEFVGPGISRVAFGPDSDVILELPPVAHPGATKLSFRNLVTGEKQRGGPWNLTLNGPREVDFASIMRLETLRAETVDIAGTSVLVNGTRSASRTVITYALPEGFRELAPPRMTMPDGKKVQPVTFEDGGSGIEAAFPVTAMGSAVNLEFGPFGKDWPSSSTTVTVNLAQAMTRAGVNKYTDGNVPFIAADVTGGDPNVPLSFAIGRERTDSSQGVPMDFGRTTPNGEVDALTLHLRGTFHFRMDSEAPSPYTSTPGLRDAHDMPLRILWSSAGYAKSADGSITTGETKAVYFLEPWLDMSRVTIVLGNPATVISGNSRVTLAAPK